MTSEQEISQVNLSKNDSDTNEKSEKKLSKKNLFFNIIRNLEGKDKIPIKENILLNELAKTGRFTLDEAEEFITKMHRESAIYESKTGCYNRV